MSSPLRQLNLVTRILPRRSLWLGLGAMFVSSLLDGLGLGLFVPFLRVFLDEGSHLPEWLSTQSKEQTLLAVAVFLVVVLVLKSGLYYQAQIWTGDYKERVVEYLRAQLYKTYLSAPLNFFNTAQLGKLTATLQGEVNKIRLLLGHGFTLLTSSMTLLAYVGILLVVSWRLTLAVLVLIGLVVTGLSHLLKQIKQRSRVTTQIGEELAFQVLNVLAGILVVKSYGTETFEQRRFEALGARQIAAQQKLLEKQAWIDPLTETTTFTLVMIMLVGAYRWLIVPGLLQVSGLLVFMVVLIRTAPLLRKLNMARASLQEELPYLTKVLTALELYQRYPLPVGTAPFPGFKQTLCFQGVNFAYPDQPPVLTGIDLTIERGTTVALVGASGAGKSTLTNLIPRFYEVTGGTITMDGVDIRHYDVASLRSALGLVNQDTYLFNATVRENIAYGCLTPDEQTLVEVAQLARAHDFIIRLPQGYDTLVGDRGVQLSGGQRQRLALARVLLRNPEILILDEATSALDAESESLIQEALDLLRQRCTIIVIAHRLATVRNADRIVVMERGKIIEQGIHQDLLAQRGLYWSYHHLQTLPV